jgi:hydrogenase maturation protease
LKKKRRVLLYGYGNPGRKDDGLGPVLSDLLEKWIVQEDLKNMQVDSNYQLNIEDALTIRDYDIVIFIDASIEDIDSFTVTRVEPSDRVNYTMHSVSPSFVLHLCEKIFQYVPETFLVHIKGYEFELEEGLSDKAAENLHLAFRFIKDLLLEPGQLTQNIALQFPEVNSGR